MFYVWKPVEAWILLIVHLCVLHKSLSRGSQRSIFLPLDSRSRMGTYQVLELRINLFTVKFHLVFLKQLLSMQIWNAVWGNLKMPSLYMSKPLPLKKEKSILKHYQCCMHSTLRFSYLVSGNAEKAREILTGALDQVQLSKPFLEALIHFETILPPPKQIDYLESLVDKFIASNSDGSAADREDLSSIFLEFLSLFGDVQSIKKAEDRRAKLFLPHRPMSELRKHHAEDFLSSDKTKLAKSYSGAPSPGQSLMGAYPNAINQWPAGYGAQPQTWPPTSQAQAQAQPWTPGYSQQAAYGSYGSNYATPQVSTSVPQSASYGTYQTTYPVQTFSQQSYAQPAAATTLTPAQQLAAAVPQTYSGT